MSNFRRKSINKYKTEKCIRTYKHVIQILCFLSVIFHDSEHKRVFSILVIYTLQHIKIFPTIRGILSHLEHLYLETSQLVYNFFTCNFQDKHYRSLYDARTLIDLLRKESAAIAIVFNLLIIHYKWCRLWNEVLCSLPWVWCVSGFTFVQLWC